jgi:hypothetical protein
MAERSRKSAAELEARRTVPEPPKLAVVNPGYVPPEPPAHLGDVEQRIWRDITAAYKGVPMAYDVLRVDLEAHQQARRCAEQIERDGLAILNRDRVEIAHPLLGPEIRNRRLFLQALKVTRS